jgi:hypothetical protein
MKRFKRIYIQIVPWLSTIREYIDKNLYIMYTKIIITYITEDAVNKSKFYILTHTNFYEI